MTGSPVGAMKVFFVFYVVCVLVTWLVYGRRKPQNHNDLSAGWRLTPYPAYEFVRSSGRVARCRTSSEQEKCHE
jgi:hypothetical protein